MSTNASVKVLKTSPFKGGTRTWSNRYHFNGGTPADATHWHTLMDNIVTAEKAMHTSAVTIVECIGYAAGSDVPVASKVYTTAGTLTVGGTDRIAQGQSASLIRYSTSARTTKNHPIYLYNYYHACYFDNTTGSGDKLSSAQKSAMATYATAWISGFSDGTITAVRAGPNSDVATGQLVEEYITHRDFPYTTSV